MSPEVVTHICVTKAYKCGISDLQVSFAKVLLAEDFVCKIVMLMRPSDGFFFLNALYSGNFCWQKGRKKSTLSPGRKNVSTVLSLSLLSDTESWGLKAKVGDRILP